MKIIGIIPARMAATRFPNKPLALIQGMPMIGHCYFRSKMSALLNEVYVATCDQEIYDYVIKIGGKAIMTSGLHERATERSAEALIKIEKISSNVKIDIVVMIQGDEPLIDPEMINESVKPLLNGENDVSNLMVRLKDVDEAMNKNFVKVVFSQNNKALFMSREPIPSPSKFKEQIDYYRQLGLIAFTRSSLIKFVSLSTTRLEIIESIDMNRFLENQVPIHMTETKYAADSVDTIEDLENVNLKMQSDILYKKYKID
jgi:3-deoxy-manno-octulosonate cytidylyltransferase (CMP-KDO synthetase)